ERRHVGGLQQGLPGGPGHHDPHVGRAVEIGDAMKKKNNTIPEKLTRWQQRLADSNHAYSDDVAKMDERERIYNGDNSLLPLVPGDTKRNGQPKKTSHVRNIVFENIESQVSSSIPSPKVTP